MNALTGACMGFYGGLGVWGAVQRDSVTAWAAVWASGARVDAHRGAHRGGGAWCGLGLGWASCGR